MGEYSVLLCLTNKRLSLRAAALPRVWTAGSESYVNVIGETIGKDTSHEIMSIYISIPNRA
jgi:3D (Asp-Asp-Asp) domain-containing protein